MPRVVCGGQLCSFKQIAAMTLTSIAKFNRYIEHGFVLYFAVSGLKPPIGVIENSKFAT